MDKYDLRLTLSGPNLFLLESKIIFTLVVDNRRVFVRFCKDDIIHRNLDSLFPTVDAIFDRLINKLLK